MVAIAAPPMIAMRIAITTNVKGRLRANRTIHIKDLLLGLQYIEYRQEPVSNKAPAPAVTAIASAPQKVTRAAPFSTLAPPAQAAIPPSRASEINEAPAMSGNRSF